MLGLKVAVFCLLVVGSSAFTQHFFNFFNLDCNPPHKLVGKFCAALFDNDVNEDGVVNTADFDHDLILYDFDRDVCAHDKWEVVSQWTCRYGWSPEYARFMFKGFDRNGDGQVRNNDFTAGSFSMANPDFLMMQYNRFKNDYCGDPANRMNPIDRKLCAQVDELRPEDVKCD